MNQKPLASAGFTILAAMALAACTTRSSSSASSSPATSPVTQLSVVASPSTVASTAVSALSPSQQADNVHLTDYAANTDGPNSTVILSGAIGDYGTGITVGPDGTVDPEHTSDLKLTLTTAHSASTSPTSTPRSYPTSSGNSLRMHARVLG